MNINADNYKQYAWFTLALIALSTLTAYLIYLALNSWFNGLPVAIQILISLPSVSLIYAGFFSIFDNVLWKIPLFRWLGIVIAEDLNGTWQGIVRSSNDGFATEIPATLVIRQSATKIKIRGKFNESKSISLFENFCRSEIDDRVALYYFFRNEPANDAPETMAMHEGSTMLVYDRSTNVLSGYYYSGRNRNNHGTISVKKS